MVAGEDENLTAAGGDIGGRLAFADDVLGVVVDLDGAGDFGYVLFDIKLHGAVGSDERLDGDSGADFLLGDVGLSG